MHSSVNLAVAIKVARKFFAGKNGELAIWQRPNAALIAWAVFLVLAKLLPHGGWRSTASFLSFVALAIWAILEIFWGASYFRRTLGAVVLAVTLFSRLH